MKTKENKYIKFLFVVYKWSIYKLGFLGCPGKKICLPMQETPV